MIKKVIVAGSRSFGDYEFLESKLNHLFSETLLEDLTIISGTAKGADQLGERYAENKGIKLIKIPAQWDLYSRKAGYIRNKAMADIATHCVVFWDQHSKGTKHMIDIAKDKNLILRVYNFSNIIKLPREEVPSFNRFVPKSYFNAYNNLRS